jgi:inosine-uridine nucleoside N-ribohydrolase
MADISSAPKRLFVIDTDAGLDDAQAILMALSAGDVRLLGITTVRGNAPTAHQVARNVLRVLKVGNSLDVSTARAESGQFSRCKYCGC